MTEPAAPHGTTSTLPPASANGPAPPRPAPQPPGRGQLRTRISEIRTAIAGALAMAAAGPGRITQLRQIIRRALGKVRAG